MPQPAQSGLAPVPVRSMMCTISWVTTFPYQHLTTLMCQHCTSPGAVAEQVWASNTQCSGECVPGPSGTPGRLCRSLAGGIRRASPTTGCRIRMRRRMLRAARARGLERVAAGPARAAARRGRQPLPRAGRRPGQLGAAGERALG